MELNPYSAPAASLSSALPTAPSSSQPHASPFFLPHHRSPQPFSGVVFQPLYHHNPSSSVSSSPPISLNASSSDNPSHLINHHSPTLAPISPKNPQSVGSANAYNTPASPHLKLSSSSSPISVAASTPPTMYEHHSPPSESSAVKRSKHTSSLDPLTSSSSKSCVGSANEELCLVCHDRASGYHYYALTCEGCKGFFRRTVTRNNLYECKYGGNCEMDMYMRRKCQHCRYKKCLEVGMSPGCVVPEKQCKAKRLSKEKMSPNSRSFVSSSSTAVPFNASCVPAFSKSPSDSTLPIGLSQEHRELIMNLVYIQDRYELPIQEEINDIYSEEELTSTKTFQRFAVIVTQLIVEFAKKIPEFSEVRREDQIILLKDSIFELMVVRTARRYDVKSDLVIFANNKPFDQEAISKAINERVSKSQFAFYRRMGVLKADNAEYALLQAIVLFAERPNLAEPEFIEKIQEKYVDVLHCYVGLQRPARESRIVIAKLLMKLTELRTISTVHSEWLSSNFRRSEFPDLLSEVWDLK